MAVWCIFKSHFSKIKTLANTYLFKSERLGFRNWLDSDLPKMLEISSNPVVMEFFPSVQDEEHTRGFIQRMQREFEEKGFCYFAVERLDNGQFIGFIGLSEQHYDTDFTPCVDIGWRIHPKHWNQGFATEGAKRCLVYAFEVLKLENIKAIAPMINKKSERVMQKIGMRKVKTFDHPLLRSSEKLRQCVLYEAEK